MWKESRITTKLRVVFNVFMNSDSAVSLKDRLLIEPTVNTSLINVLLRFWQHKVALTTDVSKMYQAVLLAESQRDLRCFLWREDMKLPLKEYRMMRLTFGISVSTFAAIMAVRQNAMDHELSFLQATKAILDAFYVDDGLIGADSITQGIELQNQHP